MSMEVDLSTPLTEAERNYLLERGQYARIEQVDAMHGVETPAFPAGDGTGPVSHGTATYDQRDAKIAELEAQLRLLKGDEAVDEEDDEDASEPDPYETWTVQELDAELGRRNLDVTGKKQEKVDRLYADDEAATQA